MQKKIFILFYTFFAFTEGFYRRISNILITRTRANQNQNQNQLFSQVYYQVRKEVNPMNNEFSAGNECILMAGKAVVIGASMITKL